VAPAFIIFALFVLAPMVHTFVLSLFSWDGVTAKTFVGFKNFQELATDTGVHEAFEHAGILVLFYAILPISIGLFLAAALTRRTVRGLTAYRTVLFLPQVISTAVVAVTWRFIYRPDGPLNALLKDLSLGGLARPWLADFGWALPALGLVGTWIMTGLCIVLFLAGIQQIPSALYEAARIDGAGPVREFLAVTLPGLRNVLAVVATLTVTAGLRAFDIIYISTNGGPGTSTMVPGLLIYRRAFLDGKVGSAAAIAVVLTLIIVALSLVILRIVEREEA
jgi:raffinose/stachyose/melibiose transport system permease protein